MRVLIVGFGWIGGIRRAIQKLMEQGFVVETAESQAEALEKAYENPPEIIACWRILSDGLGLMVPVILHEDARFAKTEFIVEFYVSQFADEAAEQRRQRAETYPWIYFIEPPTELASLIAAIKQVAKQVNQTKE